jgi:hypothetical protein
MKRREFITLIGAAVTWPITTHAQQAEQITRIGFLGTDPDNAQFATSYPAFLAELSYPDCNRDGRARQRKQEREERGGVVRQARIQRGPESDRGIPTHGRGSV